jgi:HSP20 family protein
MSLFRNIGRTLGDTVLENVGRAVGQAQERKPLPVDLLESEDAYLAVFDAPGVHSTDVQVQFREHAVEVRIDRFRDFHEGFEMRYPGRGLSLDGRVELPADAHVDASAATATLTDNGTLEVHVPKTEPPEGEATGDVDADEDTAADEFEPKTADDGDDAEATDDDRNGDEDDA